MVAFFSRSGKLKIHSFLKELVKLDPRLAVLKIFMIFRVYCYFFPIFKKIFRKTLMIYNTRNWSNVTKSSQKEKKTCFNAHFQYSSKKSED